MWGFALIFFGAENEVRTRDPQLGKLMDEYPNFIVITIFSKMIHILFVNNLSNLGKMLILLKGYYFKTFKQTLKDPS